MNTVKNWLLAIAAFGIIGGFLFWNISLQSELKDSEDSENQEIPDTLRVNEKSPHLLVKQNRLPKVVTVYQKDTALRDTLQKRDIITKISFDKKTHALELIKIKPNGEVWKQDFKLTENDSFTIDSDGHLNAYDAKLRKKKKVKNFIKATAAILGTAGTVYLTYRILTKT